MKCCLNMACGNHGWDFSSQGYCKECGQILSDCLLCRCGKAQVNPKYEAFFQKEYQVTHFCSGCGMPLTAENIGHLMAQALGTMVKQVAEAFDVRRN